VKRVCPIGVALLLGAIACSFSQEALEQIDQAVSQIGHFILLSVPDQRGVDLSIQPFPSDKSGRVTLGDRLKSELELFLASELRYTRIIPQPEGSDTYVVSGELQSYPGTIRILCRIGRPDGSLAGGTRLDMVSSPELEALMAPSAFGLPGHDDTATAPTGSGPDPFEPDDVSGSEVAIPDSGMQLYSRYLTPGDVDRYRFVLTEQRDAVVETRTAMDVQLLFYREGERIPFEVKGNRGQETLRVQMSLKAGAYILEILAFDLNAQGEYVLAVDLSGEPPAQTRDAYEPDDALAEARSIGPGSVQQRTLLPGDQDWVELSVTQPGFYALHTQGRQADTVITVFDERGHEILADDNSGLQGNAYVPLFLGTRRTYARVSSKASLGGGAYTLVFDRIAPPQIYPSSAVQDLQAQEGPFVFQLRIIESARYFIRKQGLGQGFGVAAPVQLSLYSLPLMRAAAGEGSLYSLSAGDYLLVLASAQPQEVRFCVAPEGQEAGCLGELPE
jgi:hypothetical protein